MGTELRHLLPVLAALADPGSRHGLDEVGAMVGLSPSRAQRVITALTGESPKSLQRRTRLDLGAMLLIASEARVIDVALASGFDSHEGFTRAFRQRFGRSPTEWRHERRSLSMNEADAVVSTSRCVRLYRRSITRKDPAMSYDIETRAVDPVPVLYQARKVDRDELGAVLGEVLPVVFEYAVKAGLAPAGHPYVRHVGMSPAYLSIEAGVPLVEGAPDEPPAESGIVRGELPGGTVAATVHQGPYEGLGDAYAALERWISGTGAEPTGAPWELYLTDPGEVPDPAQWLTEVKWPIGEQPG
ncbi:helix-turn-helix domain-containing protein [Nocardiopsis sp. LOL_012]|uniref:helix-turn-helix domain-containing protein n=1 Tax=Nocardiopsis sp. LOL_012 TaxID=3345409 RepID=UPI003A83FE2D